MKTMNEEMMMAVAMKEYFKTLKTLEESGIDKATTVIANGIFYGNKAESVKGFFQYVLAMPGYYATLLSRMAVAYKNSGHGGVNLVLKAASEYVQSNLTTEAILHRAENPAMFQINRTMENSPIYNLYK